MASGALRRALGKGRPPEHRRVERLRIVGHVQGHLDPGEPVERLPDPTLRIRSDGGGPHPVDDDSRLRGRGRRERLHGTDQSLEPDRVPRSHDEELVGGREGRECGGIASRRGRVVRELLVVLDAEAQVEDDDRSQPTSQGEDLLDRGLAHLGPPGGTPDAGDHPQPGRDLWGQPGQLGQVEAPELGGPGCRRDTRRLVEDGQRLRHGGPVGIEVDQDHRCPEVGDLCGDVDRQGRPPGRSRRSPDREDAPLLLGLLETVRRAGTVVRHRDRLIGVEGSAKGVVGRSLDAGTDLGRVEPGVDEGRDAHLPEQSLGGFVSLRRRTDHRQPAASEGQDGLPIQPADVRPDDCHVTVAGRRGAEQVREVRAPALHADPWDLTEARDQARLPRVADGDNEVGHPSAPARTPPAGMTRSGCSPPSSERMSATSSSGTSTVTVAVERPPPMTLPFWEGTECTVTWSMTFS